MNNIKNNKLITEGTFGSTSFNEEYSINFQLYKRQKLERHVDFQKLSNFNQFRLKNNLNNYSRNIELNKIKLRVNN